MEEEVNSSETWDRRGIILLLYKENRVFPSAAELCPAHQISAGQCNTACYSTDVYLVSLKVDEARKSLIHLFVESFMKCEG